MNNKEKCYKVRELLSLYIDKELSAEEISIVETHLESCESCKKEYLQMLKISELLREFSEVEIPKHIDLTLKKALVEEGQKIREKNLKKQKKINWKMISSIAAVFLVGLISYAALDNMTFLPNDIEKSLHDQNSNYIEDTKDKTNNNSIKELDNSDDKKTNINKENDSEEEKKEVGKKQELSSNQNSNTDIGDNNISNKNDIPETYESDEGNIDKENTLMSSEENKMRIFMKSEAAGASSSIETNEDNSNIESNEDNTGNVLNENVYEKEFYEELINEKLKDFEYEIKESSNKNNGEWYFEVFIFKGKDGNIIDKEIEIVGNEGTIEILSEDEIKGL
ncbi:anti-sigma factor family protein [Anaerovorax odorimutans]|uniref:anti-sigma factor family protein n=1 Tax=Anaerovorax odorimutans TaxID=109327 RepID=UPI000419E1A4|nr:zf-HC2 domain-containing protein [Anaerovorax odorimutans]